jgi:ribosome-binding protein aMBF1 (putative translation factor)
MPRSMVQALAIYCRSGREARELSYAQVAARAGVSEGVVRSFEQAKGWPREPDALIEAYARLFGMRESAVWRESASLIDE